MAAIAPRTPGEIAICVFSQEPWHPMDIVTRGLGGTETAASRLAEGLAELGYVVTLYGDCEEGMLAPKSRDRPHVMIRHASSFDPTVERLAVIGYAWPALFDAPVNAERKLLWMQDGGASYRLTAQRARQIEKVVCVSGWFREYLAARYPFIARKLCIVRNGITPTFFTRQPAPERQQRVLYTSGPDRGLDVLLEIWPTIREAVPKAELVHTCAPVHDQIMQWDQYREFRQRVRELADQPGVRSLSGLPQHELAELMRSSLVWAHPSYRTFPGVGKFYETSCISAMEAQAAGCCVVAGNWGALPETVQVGTLISGEPDQQEWRDRFAKAIIAGLTDKHVQHTAQIQGPEIALRWDWAEVAEMAAALLTSSAGRRRGFLRWRAGSLA